MDFIKTITLVTCIALLMLSCSKEDDQKTEGPKTYSYEFSDNTEGWTGGFADYPEGGESFYELNFSYDSLPTPLDLNDGSLMITGNNHSDDLFMYVKKKIDGLTPGKTYKLLFSIEFASNIADNTTGVGGSPGESVTIKAGASDIEPDKVLENGFYKMNIDKNNQTNGGEDMIVLGDFSNDTENSVYTLKTISNTDAFEVQTNSKGELWLIVGTDSGFESTTTIYYNKIEVRVE